MRVTVSLRLAVSVILVLTLAACSGGSTASTTPSPSAADTASTAPSAVQTTAPSSGPKFLKTDTPWGRIWDGLPTDFPTYPGSTTDEEATGGPASAVFVVEGRGAKDVATFLQAGLEKAGYTAVGSSQPLEDGSIVLDMTGSPKGCMLQVTVTPKGGLTSITVLYGATCPLG